MKWRKYVNEKLKKEYKKLFAMIDHFIFMKIPNFNVVFKWRLLQEDKLKKKSHLSKKITTLATFSKPIIIGSHYNIPKAWTAFQCILTQKLTKLMKINICLFQDEYCLKCEKKCVDGMFSWFRRTYDPAGLLVCEVGAWQWPRSSIVRSAPNSGFRRSIWVQGVGPLQI